MASAADSIKIPRTKAYSERIAREFQELRADGELADITIHASTRSYRCHQTILAGVSPVLRATFRSRMVEATTHEVKLEHISSEIMEILLTYMYTGEVYIPHEDLVATIEASDFLQLLELKELCLSEAVADCKPSNVLAMYKLSEKFDVDALKSRCAELIATSLAEISKFKEFQKLQSTELNRFLGATKESLTNPDDLLEATLDWIEYKPDDRITSLESMVQNIDISECSIECLEREIKNHTALLAQCPNVHFIFTNGLVQIAKRGGSRKKYRKRRGGEANKIIVLGGQKNNTLNKLCWELNEAGFDELCHIPQCSVRFAVCKTPTGFAITGGEGCRECLVFHMTTEVWESLPSLRHPRYAHGAACVDRKIMVFGGRVSGSSLSATVQSLSLDGGEWTDEQDIPKRVDYPEVASVDSGIFLLDTSDSNKLFHLNTETKLWSTLAPVPSPCRGASMVCVDDQLLVAGGNNVFANYNISTDTWSTGSKPLMKHCFGALVYDNSKLYLMGGDWEDRVEEFSMDSKSWCVSDIRVPQRLINLHALYI